MINIVKLYDDQITNPKQQISIKTPIGKLTAHPSFDLNNPGIFIDINGESVALVEFTEDRNILRTLAWEKDKEDYRTETIWR